MAIKNYVISVLLIVSVGLLMLACKKEAKEKVVVKGSTTVLPIAQRSAEVFYEKNKVVISLSGTGSGDGIKALIDGSCDIANSSREMHEVELEMAKRKGETIKGVAIAYDMIVPIVHPSNPVGNLTLHQLKAIYEGSVKNWNDVGGNDETIVVISRDSSSGTYEVWESKVMKNVEVRKDALLQASNGAVLSVVARNKKAIGYVGYGYLNDTVKVLFVNSVEPTIPNGKSGKYPIARKLYMYVNDVKIKPAAQNFIDFILSPEGQSIVKETGFIPIID
ncbi:MAG TPA: phosphate ABC transporter substrate-binding protein [Spirochaetota bacterium]|nr:phosphate ABC transporter substrate-binding protein [Spirochaetota bacterium]HOM87702.1 phosphate ABC transporter substrate-binding protein [Spirochaetota bacterium]HPD05268.1 phosphate ABC transporter substrate-binding protein [Spirochaetota bacterium]HQG43232.1 phosphate ABC transporter substrate-binding protein [Spirochaetota bacterium]HQI39091.1 phosphate ABC transporter substrate-binding protein [Spirochaetota bacterium]